eukprot:comp12334_c0_seq1/m.7193 comp12334_c0_seq1/g.7193  ORF comp12334_c0_seq1/g.7193 comp12334_c0_seq1/m.7193 type:complete len:167 (-) comp12334_c0_seq1:613-1113(-)
MEVSPDNQQSTYPVKASGEAEAQTSQPTSSGSLLPSNKILHLGLVGAGLVCWIIYMAGVASAAATIDDNGGKSYKVLRYTWWSVWYLFFLLLAHAGVSVMGRVHDAKLLLLVAWLYNLVLLTSVINDALDSNDTRSDKLNSSYNCVAAGGILSALVNVVLFAAIGM